MNTPKEKECCGGLGLFGQCGRGTRRGCKGLHCKCMSKDCPNMHYVECLEHYLHVEYLRPTQHKDWEEELLKHETLHTGNCYCGEDARCNYHERLVAFIRQTLAAQREEVAREVCGKHGTADYYRDQGRAACLKEIREKLSNYHFKTYSCNTALFDGNVMLSKTGEEKGLIKLIDLKDALDTLLEQ